MTENDPPAPDRSSTPAPEPQGHSDGTGQEPPSPWSAEAAAAQQHVAYDYPYRSAKATTQYPTTIDLSSGQQRQERNAPASTKFVVAIALLALLVGGGAGAAGGYLAADQVREDNIGTALDAPPPAKQTGAAPEGSVEAVAQNLMPSVVEFRMPEHPGFRGSGVILSEDGYILTNSHVIDAGKKARSVEVVFENGDRAEVDVVGRDPTTDIAVVKAQDVTDLVPVELGRSDDLRVGQSVVAIGSPYSFSGTVTAGIISALNRPVIVPDEQGRSDQNKVLDAIQTDTAVNPGNSGGPLANMQGQVIGITSASYRTKPQQIPGLPEQSGAGGHVGIGFAIPIDQARRTADSIIESGHAMQTYIGATVGTNESGGAVIVEVLPDTPAEEAGLEAGDIVVEIDDRRVEEKETLIAAIRTRAPEEQVTLTLSDGETRKVTLGGQPLPPN